MPSQCSVHMKHKDFILFALIQSRLLSAIMYTKMSEPVNKTTIT